MKILHQFKVNRETEKDVPVPEKDSAGNDITVLRKEKVTIPETYIIRKPNRQDYDEAEFFYDKLFSDNVRAGILTRSEIIKRFADQDMEIKKVYDNYTAKEAEFQRLNLQEKTEENINKKNKVEQELLNILIDIQNFEVNKSSVFDRTAENRSRARTILWWILNLAYKKDGDKETPLFAGNNYEEKLAEYDRLSEIGDKHFANVIQGYFYFIPAWYSGKLNSKEDFDKAEKLLQTEIAKQTSDAEKTPEDSKNDNSIDAKQ